MTNHWIDVKNADAIMVIGSNCAENHPATFYWVHAAMDKGAKLIVVDPRVTRTAAKADIYAPLRPGTDIAFIGGIINYVLENKLYHEEYVKAYTNAASLISPDYKGPAELEGVFSGYDAAKKSYATASWQYQTEKIKVKVKEKDAAGNEVEVEKEATVVKTDPTLQDPNCIFQVMKRHYARYTLDKVSAVTGCPKATLEQVAKAFGATGQAGKAGTIIYAMGGTQHTVGTQNVRAYAVLQLLLGNIGVAGGGVNALRGESNVQGSTDLALLFHDLPGYLGAPHDKNPDYKAFADSINARGGYWSNGGRFFTSLLKAWWGDKATKDNNYAYAYLPKRDAAKNYSWIPLFEAMYQGKIKGLWIMGQNPAICGPNQALERAAMAKLVDGRPGDFRHRDLWLLEERGRRQPGGHQDGGVLAAGGGRPGERGQRRQQRAYHSVALDHRAAAR